MSLPAWLNRGRAGYINGFPYAERESGSNPTRERIFLFNNVCRMFRPVDEYK